MKNENETNDSKLPRLSVRELEQREEQTAKQNIAIKSGVRAGQDFHKYGGKY